jgi:hypothetical protein
VESAGEQKGSNRPKTMSRKAFTLSRCAKAVPTTGSTSPPSTPRPETPCTAAAHPLPHLRCMGMSSNVNTSSARRLQYLWSQDRSRARQTNKARDLEKDAPTPVSDGSRCCKLSIAGTWASDLTRLIHAPPERSAPCLNALPTEVACVKGRMATCCLPPKPVGDQTINRIQISSYSCERARAYMHASILSPSPSHSPSSSFSFSFSFFLISRLFFSPEITCLPSLSPSPFKTTMS